MILDKPGQTFGYCKKTFTVGGTVWIHDVDDGTHFLTVKVIYTCTDSVSGPSALCEHSDGWSARLDLSKLEPVAIRATEPTGQIYTLYTSYDSENYYRARVLGVSDDRSVLLRLMLEDSKNEPQAELIENYRDESDDTLRFAFEDAEKPDAFYMEYIIRPIPVFPRPKGGIVE